MSGRGPTGSGSSSTNGSGGGGGSSSSGGGGNSNNSSGAGRPTTPSPRTGAGGPNTPSVAARAPSTSPAAATPPPPPPPARRNQWWMPEHIRRIGEKFGDVLDVIRDPAHRRWVLVVATLGPILLLLIVRSRLSSRIPLTLTATALLAAIQGNTVAEVALGSEVWRATYKDKSIAQLAISSEVMKLYGNDLREALKSAKVVVKPLETSLASKLSNVGMFFIPVVYAAVLYAMLYRLQNPRGDVGKKAARSERRITFGDVAGVPEAVAELQECVGFLAHPERFATVGARMPRGVLLYGPAGTGKTLLARALAGEANVPFISCSASDFVEVLVGRGAARVRDLFTRARASAPCIVFIDELDAIGKARGGLHSHDEREQTLNQLLTEMDGFNTPGSKPILVVAATNRLDVLDSALCRAGRFDKRVAVALPSEEGRAAILAVHARRIALAPDADLAKVARETTGCCGAELENLINEAALTAVRNGLPNVTNECLQSALNKQQAWRGRV